MIDNIKALNRLETTKDYLKELYREQVENCPYPELKAIAKQTYEDNQMAFNIAIKAIKESNRQQAEIERLKENEETVIREYGLVNADKERILLIAAELSRKLKTAKAEAVKEFAERLKKEIDIRPTYSREQNKYVFFLIDNLVKEMVGEVWDDMEVLK